MHTIAPFVSKFLFTRSKLRTYLVPYGEHHLQNSQGDSNRSFYLPGITMVEIERYNKKKQDKFLPWIFNGNNYVKVKKYKDIFINFFFQVFND